jgi:hypothetical protein
VSATFAGTGNALRLRVQEIPETGTNDNSYIVDNFVVLAAGAAAPAAAVPALDSRMLAILAGLLLAAGLAARRWRQR